MTMSRTACGAVLWEDHTADVADNAARIARKLPLSDALRAALYPGRRAAA